jgi:hypothetical protein
MQSRSISFPLWLSLSIVLLPAGSAIARDEVFLEDFEWGDTGEWSEVQPPRCDRIDPFDRGLAPSSEIHVATTGSNNTGDGSVAFPYATIQRAAQDAVPGTAIRVHSGTYSGGIYLSDLTGTETAPIWIGGAPGETRAIILGNSEGIHLTRAKYVVLHDLEVTGASANGVNSDDGGDYDDPLAAHHLSFRNLDIHEIGSGGNQDCLKLSGIHDYWVLDSAFENCGGGTSGSGVDHVGCHRGLLARNAFRHLSANAIQSKGGSEDIEIRWNRFFEAGLRSLNLGGSTGFEYFRPALSAALPNAEARNIRLVANLIEGSEAAAAYVGCTGCVVAHNTIINPHNWILRILQETTSSPPFTFEACSDGVFVNNLIYFERADLSTYLNIGPNTASNTFIFANNLWYAWDNPGQSTPNLPTPESNGLYGLDPALDNQYRIAPTSPASGAGQPTAWSWGDLSGTCYANTPSIGAFE